jgi:hypothetical protein
MKLVLIALLVVVAAAVGEEGETHPSDVISSSSSFSSSSSVSASVSASSSRGLSPSSRDPHAGAVKRRRVDESQPEQQEQEQQGEKRRFVKLSGLHKAKSRLLQLLKKPEQPDQQAEELQQEGVEEVRNK